MLKLSILFAYIVDRWGALFALDANSHKREYLAKGMKIIAVLVSISVYFWCTLKSAGSTNNGTRIQWKMLMNPLFDNGLDTNKGNALIAAAFMERARFYQLIPVGNHLYS